MGFTQERFWALGYQNDQAAINNFKKGKTKDQVEVFTYFTQEGCMSGEMKDEEYSAIVYAKCATFDMYAKALEKCGLDEEEVTELPPVCFEGYAFDEDTRFYKKTNSGSFVSSQWQCMWLLFSDTQVYTYEMSFNMEDDVVNESTNEFFYKDITSFSTSTISKTNEAGIAIASNNFFLTVPGDQLKATMGEGARSEDNIKAMKHKLREKKNA